MTKISVIVPAYNVEKVVGRCVESLLEQTYADFELILVNDGSADRTGEICDFYAMKDQRVRVIHQTNSGVSIARNKGLEIAEGKYVVFVDSDDYVEKDFLQYLYVNRSDLTICGFVAEDERNNCLYYIKYEALSYPSKNLIDYVTLYKKRTIYSPYGKLFLNSIIESNNLRFPEGINWGEDAMFMADYLQYAEFVKVIENTGYHYVRYDKENTLSTKLDPKIIDVVEKSRLYCAEKMVTTAPDCVEQVKAICVEDIMKNISYFVIMLFDSKQIGLREKKKVFQRWMDNKFVAETFEKADIYYRGTGIKYIVFLKNNFSTFILIYHINKSIIKILGKVYRCLLKCMRNIRN